MRILATVLLCAALSSLSAPAAASDQCPNGGNLVSNCGIEAPGGISGDTSGWELLGGDELDNSSQFSHTGGFSAKIDAVDQGGGASFFAGMETCVRGVQPGALYLFGAWRHLTDAGSFVTCTVSVEELGAPAGDPAPEGDPACLGSTLDNYSQEIAPTNDTWQDVVSKFQAHESVLDIKLAVSCLVSTDAADFTVHLDDMFLIPLDVVFHDDFDFFTDSCNWSASVGGSCD
jgi:hypothetical protein